MRLVYRPCAELTMQHERHCYFINYRNYISIPMKNERVSWLVDHVVVRQSTLGKCSATDFLGSPSFYWFTCQFCLRTLVTRAQPTIQTAAWCPFPRSTLLTSSSSKPSVLYLKRSARLLSHQGCVQDLDVINPNTKGLQMNKNGVLSFLLSAQIFPLWWWVNMYVCSF